MSPAQPTATNGARRATRPRRNGRRWIRSRKRRWTTSSTTPDRPTARSRAVSPSSPRATSTPTRQASPVRPKCAFRYPPRRPTSRPPHTPTTGRARRSRPREETGTTTGTIGRKATTPRAAKRAVCSRRCRSMSARRDTATWRAPRWPARTSRASRRWASPTPHSCAATSRPTNSRRCSTKRRPRSTTA